MASVNRVMLLGRLGKDPEIRQSTDGRKIATFSVATSETWKDKSGQKQEKTEWANVVCYNQGLCDVIKSYLKKGSQVYIEGSLQTRKWTDKNGVDKYTTEVVLSAFKGELVLLDGNGSKGTAKREVEPVPGNFDDQIPF